MHSIHAKSSKSSWSRALDLNRRLDVLQQSKDIPVITFIASDTPLILLYIIVPVAFENWQGLQWASKSGRHPCMLQATGFARARVEERNLG